MLVSNVRFFLLGDLVRIPSQSYGRKHKGPHLLGSLLARVTLANGVSPGVPTVTTHTNLRGRLSPCGTPAKLSPWFWERSQEAENISYFEWIQTSHIKAPPYRHHLILEVSRLPLIGTDLAPAVSRRPLTGAHLRPGSGPPCAGTHIHASSPCPLPPPSCQRFLFPHAQAVCPQS